MLGWNRIAYIPPLGGALAWDIDQDDGSIVSAGDGGGGHGDLVMFVRSRRHRTTTWGHSLPRSHPIGLQI